MLKEHQPKASLLEVCLVFLRLGTLSFGGPAAHMNILDDRYRSSGAVNTACPDARYR